MELKFHYNKDTRRIQSDDPDIFVKPRGGVEEAQSLVLHWRERKIPFSAKLEETTNSDGVTEVRWTINYILATSKAEMYDYKSISEVKEAVGLMGAALACFNGWGNAGPFKVISDAINSKDD